MRGSTSNARCKSNGPAAALLGVQVDLPYLAQGVGLHEVPFVVDVESVVHGVVFEVRHVPGDVDGCHRRASLAARDGRSGAGLPRVGH